MMSIISKVLKAMHDNSLLLIKPTRHGDNRGFFAETYNRFGL